MVLCVEQKMYDVLMALLLGEFDLAAKVFKNSVQGGPDFFLFACQMAQQCVKAAICRN